MTYSDFSLASVCKTFGLTIRSEPLFVPHPPPLDVPQWLVEALTKGMQLAFGSEKARSEFLVVPILLTSRDLSHNNFSIYSGQRLDVDPALGLAGECDFLLTNTPPLPIIQSPIVTIVEAKKNDLEGGVGQCVAQTVGARVFNQRESSEIEMIFGCITTGEAWQFLKLEQTSVSIDSSRYYIDNVGAILAVFQAIMACYHTQHVAT
jgi:hypothetical protein